MIKQSHFRRGLSRKQKRRTAARIFEEYKNALFHTARRMVASDGDAEDAVMLTMERICRHMELLETLSEPEVQSYLYKTVRSCVIDLHRAKERQDHAFWLYAAEGALTEELPERLPRNCRSRMILAKRSGMWRSCRKNTGCSSRCFTGMGTLSGRFPPC